MFTNKQLILLLFLLSVLSGACLVMEHTYPLIAPGTWRGVLHLSPKEKVSNPNAEPLPELMDLQFEEVTRGELPFHFDVIYSDDSTVYVEIINGDERIHVREVKIWRAKNASADSIVIAFPLYDSYIRAAYEERVMEGLWIVNNRKTYYAIPFTARYGEGHRFTHLKKPPICDVSGKWAATFGKEGEQPWEAIGYFQQKGNQLKATFATETGDYRYLAGTIQQDKLYLSCFDGAHAFLFEAKLRNDSSMIGSFRSGKHYRTLWEAKRNEQASLKDPNELTFLKEGYEGVSFSFENPEGKIISSDDESFKGKAKIIQILGTWCPNCKDETIFLTEFLRKHPQLDSLVVVGLAFEKHIEKQKAMAAIKRYKAGLKLPYEILYAGSANKKEAAKAMPMLNHIMSYPTMIFIDKNDRVVKIHTGFYGPATPQFDDFKREFEETVMRLLD